MVLGCVVNYCSLVDNLCNGDTGVSKYHKYLYDFYVNSNNCNTSVRNKIFQYFLTFKKGRKTAWYLLRNSDGGLRLPQILGGPVYCSQLRWPTRNIF